MMIESSKIKLPLKNVSAANKLLESMHLDVKKARQTVFDRLNRSNDLEELVFLLKEDNNAKKLEIETLKNELNQIEDRQEINASSVKFESMETIRLIENEKNKLRETNMIYEVYRHFIFHFYYTNLTYNYMKYLEFEILFTTESRKG
jgi:hypothetical protein